MVEGIKRFFGGRGPVVSEPSEYDLIVQVYERLRAGLMDKRNWRKVSPEAAKILSDTDNLVVKGWPPIILQGGTIYATNSRIASDDVGGGEKSKNH